MNWKVIEQDFISGLVVFLVAIPLCLGIALASDTPLFSGLLAGVIGGLVVGSISSSHVSVSGPAAGMVAIVLAASAELGGFQGVLLATFLAGLIQLLLAKLRAGFIADYVPTAVIHGLLAGIGLLIVIKQLPFAFGFFSSSDDFLKELRQVQVSLDDGPLRYLLKHLSLSSIIISLLSLILLKAWESVKHQKLQLIPGPVLVVLLGVFINLFFGKFFPSLYLSSENYLVTIPVIEQITHIKKLLVFPDFSLLTHGKVYFYALLIALLGSVETLLNLEAAEKIDPQKRYCGRNRELLAQGVGNTLCGLLGALPVTSVIVRSSVNVRSGCQTKLSTIIHGLLVLLSILLFPGLLNTIPLTSLAAILIFVGLKLASIDEFKNMYRQGLETFLPFIVTTVLIVTTDLLTGVLAGLIISSIWVMRTSSRPKLALKKEVYPDSTIIRLVLPEQISFLNKAALIRTLRALPENSQVVLDGSNTKHIDYDIHEVIDDFTKNLSYEKNISLKLLLADNHQLLASRNDFDNVTTASVQENLKPADIFKLLKTGNERFVNNQPLRRNIKEQVQLTSTAQHPFAVVLGCIDSRVPVEKVFDVGFGDLFVVRVAGNVINDDIIASIEFATLHAGAKFIVILGHTECGAIKAACAAQGNGFVRKLLEKIEPAVNEQDSEQLNSNELENNVTRANVQNSKRALLSQNSALRQRIEKHEIGLVCAIYDVKTGAVTFDSEPLV
jgi:carbonic anhydrase